jgi:hypothetical protein
MLLGTENTDFQPASESLIHEMMGDATRRGRHMVLETTEAADAFIQFAFLDETLGCLEYRDEATNTLYHCARPVTALDAETAFVEYLNGREAWKQRYQWDVVVGYSGTSNKEWITWIISAIVILFTLFKLYKCGFFDALLK